MASEDLTPEEKQYPVYSIAEGRWFEHSHDCSGFTRAVAADAGIILAGNANQQIDHMRKGGGWIALGHDVQRASRMSGQGYLVIGGRPEARHGHVVVVVPGTDHGRAKGYWGSLGGRYQMRNADVSRTFTHRDFPLVEYWA